MLCLEALYNITVALYDHYKERYKRATQLFW